MRQLRNILMPLIFAATIFGQTTAVKPVVVTPVPATVTSSVPVAEVTLPPYIGAGASYNQFTGVTAEVTGLIPETSKLGGLYGSVTADLSATKIVLAGKSGYVLSPNFRVGQHKVVFNDGKNMITLGGDAGASFSQSAGSTATGLNIGLAGSFTATYIRNLSAHFAVGVPLRMLYLSGE